MQNVTVCQFSSTESWVILSKIEQNIKRKIEAVGVPLKNWDINIYRGILTGYNEAFIISGEKKEEILNNCKTPEERTRTIELIRPLLRGRDIKRYSYDFADIYLLFIPWHFPLHNDPSIKGASLKAEQEFENQYPAVYNHLLQYKTQLSNRNKAETGIRYEWYALQRWGANYWEDFSIRKIIFQEMVQEPNFMLDEEGKFMCLDTARIITGYDLSLLLAVLNSKLFFYSIKRFYGGGSLGESGVRMKHTFFKKFPLPIFSNSYKHEIERHINCLETYSIEKIENIIYNVYNLTKEEIDFIEMQ